jgi:hypothetical protein
MTGPAMISFNLRCPKDHVFEAWLTDHSAFAKQVKAKALQCPSCGDVKIEKALMSPNIAARGDPGPPPEKLHNALVNLRKMVEDNCDYVGPEFPEEARKIHYGEAEHRNIYGEATMEEALDLSEEGVEFGRVPWVPRADS